MCGAQEESIRHVLIECTVAKEVWRQVKAATGVKLPLHPLTWAADLLNGLCSEKVTTILCAMWALWTMRNKRRHGELTMTVYQAAIWAKDTAFDLWQLSHPPNQVPPEVSPPKWQTPTPGWVKVNTDAAFYDSANNGATACAVRDHTGAFKEAQAIWYEQVFDACTMETMAYRDGSPSWLSTSSSGNRLL